MLLVDPDLDEYLRILELDEAVQEDSAVIASRSSFGTGSTSGVHFVQKKQAPGGQGGKGLGHGGTGAQGAGLWGKCFGCGSRDHMANLPSALPRTRSAHFATGVGIGRTSVSPNRSLAQWLKNLLFSFWEEHLISDPRWG